MKLLLQFSLCCLLVGGVAMAQRGGSHGGGGGGSHGGGMGSMGGGISGGGGFRGGTGGFGGGYRGGIGSYGYRGGYGYGGYGYRGWGGYYPGWGYGYGYGLGLGYWPGAYGYYDYPYDSYPSYGGYYSDPSAYSYTPNTTVIYPPSQPATMYVDPPVHSSTHEYDEYGQEVQNGGGGQASSPLYLIALHDHTIQAAVSYRVDGNTLVYVTMQHEEKRVPLSSVDRDFTMQLNRERHVQLRLPQ